MFAVLNIDGSFSGVVYDDLSDKVQKHHAAFEQSFLEVTEAPVDGVPISLDPDAEHIPDYGVPSNEQLRVGMNWEHQAYLKSTDYLVLRFVETNEAIPEDIKIKRQTARDAIVN